MSFHIFQRLPIMSREEAKIVPQRRGEAHLHEGCVTSGKTSSVMAAVAKKSYSHSVVLIKYAKDKRLGDAVTVVSQGGISLASSEKTADQGSVRIISVDRLAEVKLSEEERTVGIDEGQFIPDLVEFVLKWRLEGRNIVIAALNGDFEKKVWPVIADLGPHCDKRYLHLAICACCKEETAIYSKLIAIPPTAGKENIGGKELYSPRCPYCWDLP